jgi:hypothetical protein
VQQLAALVGRVTLKSTAAAFDDTPRSAATTPAVIPPVKSTHLAMVVKNPLGAVGCIVPGTTHCCSPESGAGPGRGNCVAGFDCIA